VLSTVVVYTNNMEQLKVFYILKDGGKLPYKKHDDDAAFDIYASSEPEIVGDILEEGYNIYSSIDYIQYRTGLYLEPQNKNDILRFDLRPRSSISKYWLTLCNSPATIDHSYRNEILVRFRPVIQPCNMLSLPQNRFGFVINENKIYKKGDRICQLLPERVKDIKWMEVSNFDLNDSRGGFGSTGE